MRKNCSSDREKLLKFEAEGREFVKCLRLLEQFSQTVKGQNHRGRNIESKTECYEKDKVKSPPFFRSFHDDF